MYRYLVGVLALAPLSPAFAQEVRPTDSTTVDDAGGSEIVVTATRSQLPASALPLTIDVIDSEALERHLRC